MITWAAVDRLANQNPVVREKYPPDRLHMGSIIEMRNKEVFREKLVDWWRPKLTENIDHGLNLYLSYGTLYGDTLQNRLNEVDHITFCDVKPHREYKIIDEDHGLSGRVDLLIDVEAVKLLGAKTLKNLEKDEKSPPYYLPLDHIAEFHPFEVKQTSEMKYKKWETYLDLPLKYRCQLSLYMHYLNKEKGGFIINKRDNPTQGKVLNYNVENDLVDEAKNLANEFWRLIRERKMPKGTRQMADEWYNESIQICRERSGRKYPRLYNKLSGIDNPPEIVKMYHENEIRYYESEIEKLEDQKSDLRLKIEETKMEMQNAS